MPVFASTEKHDRIIKKYKILFKNDYWCQVKHFRCNQNVRHGHELQRTERKKIELTYFWRRTTSQNKMQNQQKIILNKITGQCARGSSCAPDTHMRGSEVVEQPGWIVIVVGRNCDVDYTACLIKGLLEGVQAHVRDQALLMLVPVVKW